jgi:HEPN domain-containing protein
MNNFERSINIAIRRLLDARTRQAEGRWDEACASLQEAVLYADNAALGLEQRIPSFCG